MLKRIFVGLYLTQMIANVGFVALILDATPEAVEFYEQLGFEYLHRDLEKDSRILDTYPMFIRMDTIKAIAEFIGVPDDPYNY
ncbi:hypothetical protein KY41_03325 [Latilactobacillus sakei]|nr:hypothetical protein KY41_03325 [Latilactobacillus sakei]